MVVPMVGLSVPVYVPVTVALIGVEVVPVRVVESSVR
mgnify:CR=1 FL=1